MLKGRGVGARTAAFWHWGWEGPGFRLKRERQGQGAMSNGLGQDPKTAKAQEPDRSARSARSARLAELAGALWRMCGSQAQQRAPVGQLGILEISAGLEVGGDGDSPEGGKGKPQAGCAAGMVHPGELPLPTAAFVAFEALLAPGAQAIPGNRAGAGRQVGEDKPGFVILLTPPSQQRTVDATGAVSETTTGSLPLAAGDGLAARRISRETDWQDGATPEATAGRRAGGGPSSSSNQQGDGGKPLLPIDHKQLWN